MSSTRDGEKCVFFRDQSSKEKKRRRRRRERNVVQVPANDCSSRTPIIMYNSLRGHGEQPRKISHVLYDEETTLRVCQKMFNYRYGTCDITLLLSYCVIWVIFVIPAIKDDDKSNHSDIAVTKPHVTYYIYVM